MIDGGNRLVGDTHPSAGAVPLNWGLVAAVAIVAADILDA